LHPFNYIAASSVDETLAVLDELGPRARILAGGTDLLVQLRGERFEIDSIVDIKQVPEARALHVGDSLIIGSAVPCYQIYENSEIANLYPGLIDAASLIGGIQIQSRASIGGNLCNASPSADGICPLIVHSAIANIKSPTTDRTIPVEDFCTGPGKNSLQNNEMLLSIKIPLPSKGFGAAYQRFIPRNEMDIAIASVGSAITIDTIDSNITHARIALGAVGPTPIFAKKSSDFLIGKQPTQHVFEEAAEIAVGEASPIGDMRGTPAQRLQLVRVLTQRTLTIALERAKTNL
tara:strand:+ start:453 stop:1325 length:873 start_codon:yes stop_codon:yes gene_type:complete